MVIITVEKLLTAPIITDPADVPTLRVLLNIVIWFAVLCVGSGVMSWLIAVSAFLPSMILIGMGEYLGIRRSPYYGLAGAAAGLIVLLFPVRPTFPTSSSASSNIHDVIVIGLAGFAGGLIYWRFAGREARGSIDLCSLIRACPLRR